MSSLPRPPQLNVVGAGKVARVLARLWRERGRYRVGDVVTRGAATAAAAVGFIGAGTARVGLDELEPAECWLIGVNDDAIAPIARRLAALELIRPGDLAFHLSGALAADALAPLGGKGARIASLHPLKSIADPAAACAGFAATPVALEGDPEACEVLARHAEAIGAVPFRLESRQKLRYHAANTILCNYLTALLDIGLEVYESAGIERSVAASMVTPLMTETLAAGLREGPEESLTGPIARGDAEVVAAHLAQLPDSVRGVYRELGRRALQLAAAGGRLPADQADRLAAVLEG